MKHRNDGAGRLGEPRFPAVVVPLPPETWNKLRRLAIAKRGSRPEPVTTADLVRGIGEQYLAKRPS